ncbi:MAG TPA: hypothetical protein VMS77_00790 [Conexivisphaerales archaeon]|nr:hypothetical protein [Conexivisphaerales archaeon]
MMVNTPFAVNGLFPYLGVNYTLYGVLFQGADMYSNGASAAIPYSTLCYFLAAPNGTDYVAYKSYGWSSINIGSGSIQETVQFTTVSGHMGWWYTISGANSYTVEGVTTSGVYLYNPTSQTYFLYDTGFNLSQVASTTSALTASNPSSNMTFDPSIALEVNETALGNLYSSNPSFDIEASLSYGQIYYGIPSTSGFGIGGDAPPNTANASGVKRISGSSTSQYDEFGTGQGIANRIDSTFSISTPVQTQTSGTDLPSLNTQYYLTMQASPGTGGGVTPSSGWRNSGTQVQISESVNSGYRFSGWSGSGTGSYTGPNSQATITMNGPITETADFVQQYCLTEGAVPGSGGGETPGNGCYDAGTQVQISAVDNSGYQFSHWSGSGSGSYSGSSRTVTITMNGDITENAYFDVSLGMGVNPAGEGTVSPGSGYYTYASGVTISESPNDGYYFTGWSCTGSGCYSGSSSSHTIYMNNPITETANYGSQYYLTMGTTGSGRGTVSPGSGYYDPGTQVQISATPAQGCNSFTSWTGTGGGSYSGTDNPASITMNGNIVETAHFINGCRPTGATATAFGDPFAFQLLLPLGGFVVPKKSDD